MEFPTHENILSFTVIISQIQCEASALYPQNKPARLLRTLRHHRFFDYTCGMKILVIGGSRFIGPRLLDILIKNKHDITVFNKGSIRTRYEKKVRFVKGDRRKEFPFRERFDAVIDTCAYRGEDTASAINQIECDFFLHIGTVAVYQKSEIFPLTEHSPIGTWPLWGEYNKGKIECEHILKTSGISYAILRPVYILGPKNYIDRERFIYAKLAKKETVVLPGNGQSLIQFVHVDDVARSLALIAEKKGEGAYNCVSDEAVTLKGLVELMAEISGQKARIAFDAAKDGVGFNEREFPFANETMVCSNEKIKKALNMHFMNLREWLKIDYENYYKFQVLKSK